MSDDPDTLTQMAEITWTWTIYVHPADYPGQFVVRRFACGAFGVLPDKKPWHVCDSLEEARASIPDGLTSFARADDDDPCILETWL